MWHIYYWRIRAIEAIIISLNPLDALSDAVSNGIRQAGVGLGDDMFNMSSAMNNTNSTYQGQMIVDIATFTYNPFNDPAVLNSLNESLMLYLLFLLSFILIGGSQVQISRMRPTRELLGMKTRTNQSLGGYLVSVFTLIILGPMIPLSMWIILMINYVICNMIMTNVLPSVLLTPDNVTLYIMMGFIYLLNSASFVWRALVIGMCVGYCLVIFILIMVRWTRDIGITLYLYFIVMVLMQPVILAITCIGVGIIQTIAPHDPMGQTFNYLVLGGFIFIVSIGFILGPGIIMWMVRRGKQTVRMVI